MFDEMGRQAQNRWGHLEELLVLLTERVDMLLRVTVLVNRDQRKSAPTFGPQFNYPRPGQPVEPTNVVRPRELATMFRGG